MKNGRFAVNSHILICRRVALLALSVPLGGRPLYAGIVMPPYLQAASTNGVCVMVECDSTNAVTVEYGPAASYGRTATTAFALPTTATTHVHRVPLTGLQSNTPYHFWMRGQSRPMG